MKVSRRTYWMVIGFCAFSAFISVAAIFYSTRLARTSYAVSYTNKQFSEQSDILKSKLQDNGLDKTFDYVKKQINEDASFAKDCHPLLHSLGREVYEKNKNFGDAQHPLGELCNSGYLHGLIEAGFLIYGDPANAVVEICNGLNGTKFKDWQCYHGVGHGAMYSTGKNLKASISLCELLGDKTLSKSCINGVFMEYFNIIDHSGRTERKQQLIVNQKDCLLQHTEHKIDCYFYSPTAFLLSNPGEYSRALDQCYAVETEFIFSCITGLGSQVMKDNVSKTKIAANFCKKILANQRQACVNGAITLYAYQNASTDEAANLCQGDFSWLQNYCLGVTEIIKTEYDI
jgi:hypothetical protein